jgi:hypothetical protein
MRPGAHGRITVTAKKSRPTAKKVDRWVARARIRDVDGISRLVERKR